MLKFPKEAIKALDAYNEMSVRESKVFSKDRDWHRADKETLVKCPVLSDMIMIRYKLDVGEWMEENNIDGGVYATTWLNPRTVTWSIPDPQDRLLFTLRWAGG